MKIGKKIKLLLEAWKVEICFTHSQKKKKRLKKGCCQADCWMHQLVSFDHVNPVLQDRGKPQNKTKQANLWAELRKKIKLFGFGSTYKDSELKSPLYLNKLKLSRLKYQEFFSDP